MTCQGDSGGGFSVKRNNKWYLRGVVSFGISKSVEGVGMTCDEKYSSLFVDVTGYMDWIVQTLKGARVEESVGGPNACGGELLRAKRAQIFGLCIAAVAFFF